MNRLPDPTQPTAPQAGQPTVDTAAHAFLQSVETAMQEANQAIADEQTPKIPTFYKDPTPNPAIGNMPPVAQPGRAPMSQKASDASGLILAVGIASPLMGGGFALAMWGTSFANFKVIGVIVGGVIGIVLAAKSFLTSAKDVVEAAPPEVHQHFNGTVHQDHSIHKHESRGMWVRNNIDDSTNLYPQEPS